MTEIRCHTVECIARILAGMSCICGLESEAGMTEQHEWVITMAGTVVCARTGDKMSNEDANRRLNEYETRKKGPSIKISDGDVWLVFPDAMISLDSILFSKPGPIVEYNLRKWRDNILEGKDG